MAADFQTTVSVPVNDYEYFAFVNAFALSSVGPKKKLDCISAAVCSSLLN
jgi:hypothetical protein